MMFEANRDTIRVDIGVRLTYSKWNYKAKKKTDKGETYSEVAHTKVQPRSRRCTKNGVMAIDTVVKNIDKKGFSLK